MRLIDADKLISDIKNCLWDWESVDGITATTVLKQTITDIENQPTILLEEQEPPTSEELKVHYGELYECKGCGLAWYQQVQRYCLHCGKAVKWE